MSEVEAWIPVRGFAERGPAEAFCVHLASENVPARIQANALENAIEGRFCVLVPSYLAHRARWVTAEFLVSEGELNFLATGKLPGQEQLRAFKTISDARDETRRRRAAIAQAF